MDLRLATHQEAVQWLVQQRGDIELFVRHVPPPPGLKVCLLFECMCFEISVGINRLLANDFNI